MKWAIPTSEGVISDYKCSAVTWKPRDNVMWCKKWLGQPTEGQCFKASIEDSQFNSDSLSCTFDYLCDITCSWSTSGRNKNLRQSATIFHPSIHPLPLIKFRVARGLEPMPFGKLSKTQAELVYQWTTMLCATWIIIQIIVIPWYCHERMGKISK